MTPKHKLDVAIFVSVAIVGAWDFWRVRQSASAKARSRRLKTAGVLLWASLLLFGAVIPNDVFGLGNSTVIMSLILVAGLVLVVKGIRNV
jgi:protein-S-isoprenylcysteine O-methyltransferase Ste14